jgi:dehydrogenase/reductase SDR family protein 7B
MKLHERVVWITGASSGIGAATARALVATGARVVLSARRAEQLEAVRASTSDPTRVVLLACDVTESSRHAALVEEAWSAFGHVDAIVHAAGVSQRATALETRLDVDRRIMELNYFAPVSLTKAALPRLLARGEGHVVVISSVAGHVAAKGRSAYAASKHALHGFFDSLRAELHDRGIRVTLVCPGYVRTPLSEAALTGSGEANAKPDPKLERGISAERCASAILSAMANERSEAVVGGPEVAAIWVKRLSPRLLAKLVAAQP